MKNFFKEICWKCKYNVGTEEMPTCDHPQGPMILVNLGKCAGYKKKEPKRDFNIIINDDVA